MDSAEVTEFLRRRSVDRPFERPATFLEGAIAPGEMVEIVGVPVITREATGYRDQAEETLVFAKSPGASGAMEVTGPVAG